MAECSISPEFVAKVACPTCGAVQSASDSCRRCHSDLALVRRFQTQSKRLRDECLALVRQRRLLGATKLARQLCLLSSAERNQRLLATCYLMQGDFAKALALHPLPPKRESASRCE